MSPTEATWLAFTAFAAGWASGVFVAWCRRCDARRAERYAKAERYLTGVRREQLLRDPAAAWTAADILHAAKMGVELGRGWKP